MVTRKKQARGRAIGLDHTQTRLPGDQIGFQTGAVFNIDHLDQFEGVHPGGFEQVGINREAAFIIDVRAGHNGAVDLGS